MPRKGARRPKPPLGDPNDPEGLGAWARRYLEALRIKNYSARTVENRESYLGFFIEWCATRSITRPQEVTKPIIDRYQRHLFHLRKPSGKPLSFSAQTCRLVPVRAYFKWLTRQNVLLWNPASEIELPRHEKRLPKHVLTADEAEAVMRVPHVSDVIGLRDRAILETLYSTGIRRMEVIHLTVWDLDQERGTLMVRQGKGKKDRMVPIGERAVAWLGRYLDEARPKLVMPPDAGVLFLTQEGEELSPNRLTQLVREHVTAAELGKTGACHLFRHTCATLMLEGGADIRYIQELLGHVELSTTQIYTRVSIRKLKAVHTLTHPGARLGQRPVADGEDEAPAGAPGNGAGAMAVAAESESGQRSAEGFPCLAAEPALNVAVTEAGDELDAEAALEGAPGGAQRPADAAGELMAVLDAEAEEDPEEGA